MIFLFETVGSKAEIAESQYELEKESSQAERKQHSLPI